MTLGPWILFNHWLEQLTDTDNDIFVDDVHAILLGGGQGLSASFVGTSTDCRYSDLTDEKPTASGYTVGGIILPNKTVVRTGNLVKFTSDPWEWMIVPMVAGIKYMALYNFDAPNKDLIAFFDFDVDSPGTNTVSADGVLNYTPHADGLVTWETP